MKKFEYILRIGILTRQIRVTEYNWGVYVVIEDITDGMLRPKFVSRNYSYTNKYPNLDMMIGRIKKLYKIEQYAI